MSEITYGSDSCMEGRNGRVRVHKGYVYRHVYVFLIKVDITVVSLQPESGAEGAFTVNGWR